MQWAISYAIYVEYEECADDCVGMEESGRSDAVAGTADEGDSESEGEELDPNNIDQFGERLSEPRYTNENSADYLQRLAKIIRFQVAKPSDSNINNNSNNSSSNSDMEVQGAADLGEFPLGFDTGDNVVNRVALVLKMLYISDLRDLQNDLNGLISLGQEYTANPKTNTKLGKVGR